MSEQDGGKWMVGKVGEAELPVSGETRTLFVKGWLGDGSIMVTCRGTKKAWEMDADDLRNIREPKL
jgi:hypothetical protein